ncbi:grasp-with-spasm system SPASM domain peptide maturase [Chryseobacterium shandongense]|uniref:grasp-with-spasm system SPASM domain peptide maturase n=1 Tax=Chryseobacterium shandongense TaxID=1493872 RepID=UPI000F4F962C|nr:grasp-with-spasm system SPASM domain peptide maturase [Chryseobacterium shandongense]AZA58770.1 grasp-with-spasm system SPASM domain peptide maturase [Chryseobacterium shandongense]
MTYKLFSDIILCNGHIRTLLLDTTRSLYYYIPNDFAAILKDNTILDFELLKKIYPESVKILGDYKKFLLKHELMFEVLDEEEASLFPKINLQHKQPFRITNAIIDIDAQTDLSYLEKIEYNFEKLCIQSLQIRIFYINDIKILITFLDKISKSGNNFLKDIQIIIVKNDFLNFNCNKVAKILCNYNIITQVDIYNYTERNAEKMYSDKIFLHKKKIHNCKSCGEIAENMSTINLRIVSESLHHNSCLHKKISIDSEGNIRNCPSMPQSFGNINNTTLEGALQHPDFKKYWNLTKDQIEVCKDCEFRYICTDCRAYTERSHTNEEGLDTSKPLKCGYNPYTGEWEEWSTNPLKQKAIQYYELENTI